MSTRKLQIIGDFNSNADTLDGKHASEFASASDVEQLQIKVGDMTVSEQLDAAIAELDMLTVDITDVEQGTATGINADTLGGVVAGEYVLQTELDIYKNEVSTMDITHDRIVMPDGGKWDGTLGKIYTAGQGIAISEDGVISLALENGDEVSY